MATQTTKPNMDKYPWKWDTRIGHDTRYFSLILAECEGVCRRVRWARHMREDGSALEHKEAYAEHLEKIGEYLRRALGCLDHVGNYMSDPATRGILQAAENQEPTQ